MSHASLIVAIEPTHKLWTAGVPEQAIAWEMEPFDENRSEMFGDGSRWDYWVIGGRYAGRFDGQNMVKVKELGETRPASYAFLRNRQWHETARLGWFGCTTATECERNGRADGKDWKCLFKDKKSGAQIVTWNSDEETWDKKFYDRFIKPLDPKTVLVVVDYHV